MRSMVILSALAFAVMNSRCAAQSDGWQTEYSSAKSAADNSALPILIHFHAWYCGPCQRMDRDVFSDHQVQQSLSDGIAAVKVDVTQEPELASQYGATTVPRDVVIYPDGTSQTLHVGYVSKSSYLSMLRDICARGRSMVVPRPVDPIIEANPGIVTNAAAESVVASNALPSAEPMILGLEGFCPVRLHDKREWTAGQEAVLADYRGIRFQFSGETERAAFLKNPAEYAPQDLGCDPVVLTDVQKAVTGSIRYGAFFDERLYLFRSPENRDQFKKNPLKFTRIRSALKADQIEGTRFQ